MLKKLKDILNTYTEDELIQMDLWVNSSWGIDKFVIDDLSIDLVTDDLIIDLKENTPISIPKENNKEIK